MASPEGKEVRVSYVADSNGFRVLSNALPEGPAAVAAVLPEPVQDTPEVAAAKAEHAAAWEAALAAAQASGEESESRKKRSVFLNAFPWTYPANTLRFAYNTNTMQYPFTTYPLAMPVSARAAAQPVREAVLSKTVHNPGHAVSYRVD